MPVKIGATNGPDCYVFISNNVDWEPNTSGRTIAKTLAAESVWLASTYTPYRKDYKAGDRVLFYVAGRGERCFVGSAAIGGATTGATAADRALARRLGLEGFAERIPLTAVKLWDPPVPIAPLLPDLQFVTDKQNWGLHLRQAAKRIPVADYDLVVGARR
jgi:hypothetical protein